MLRSSFCSVVSCIRPAVVIPVRPFWVGKLVDEIDKQKKTHLREDMQKGSGTLVAAKIYENPALKVVQPQDISPPVPFPSFKSFGLTVNLKGWKVDLPKILDKKGYKLLMVIEKRQTGFFMTNQWRDTMQNNYPDIPVFELVVVHQITQMFFLPFLWISYWSTLVPNTSDSTFCRIGPSYNFIKEVRLANPYVPNVYLIDSKGRACWVSSSAPTEEDLEQLATYLTPKQPKQAQHKKEIN